MGSPSYVPVIPTGRDIDFSGDVGFTGDVAFTGTVLLPATTRFSPTMEGTGPAPTSAMIGVLVEGDTFDRLRVRADGLLEWGPGNAARDTNLYRAAANTLKTDDAFVADGGILLTGATAATDVFTARVTGDAQPQLVINANGRIEFGGGSTAPDVALFRDGSTRLHSVNTFVTEGDLVCDVAGGGVTVREGTNARSGVATLAAGTVTVATTRVTANSRIQLTAQALGTVTAPQALAVTARTAGTSFTIASASNTDTSTVAWFIVEPAT
jgi:hypothetical protein